MYIPLELIKSNIGCVKDYPKPGILFRDISPLIANPQVFQVVVDILAFRYRNTDITKIVGTESRGFIFAAPLALALKKPFILVRKPGKLPCPVESVSYTLEYGENRLEIHKDAIASEDKVLIIDDVLATGGTVIGTVELVRKLGGICLHAAFLMHLSGLQGKERLEKLGVRPFSIIDF